MITFKTEGLEDLASWFEQFPKEAPEAARRAVNFAAQRYGKDAANKISAQLNFRTKLFYPSNPGKGRISVRLASKADLTAVVSASSEPLLLSKFATNFPKGAIRKGTLPRVQVGRSNETIKDGFFVRFKNGTTAIAVRLKKGESVRGKKTAKTYPLRKGDPTTSVLYGPSLDQAFKTKVGDSMQSVEASVRQEFIRQIGVLTNGR